MLELLFLILIVIVAIALFSGIVHAALSAPVLAILIIVLLVLWLR